MKKIIASTLLASFLIHSFDASANYLNHPKVRSFIDEVLVEGYRKDQLEEMFRRTKKQQNIINSMNRPAEQKKSWGEYRAIFLTKDRIDSGVKFFYHHTHALQRAYDVYGVEPEYIVAIIGVETFYGRNMGSYRVIDALATLAFDYAKRSEFFTQELKAFLKLAREQRIDVFAVKGSYAGAMGYGQFMPSSFLNYAVDFDGDGKRDIWNNATDAIGSVANYLYKHKWQTEGLVAIPIQSPINSTNYYLSDKLQDNASIGDLRDAGWYIPEPAEDIEHAHIFKLDNEHWAGFNNWYTITRYNHSNMYALAVTQLAWEIKKNLR